MGTSSWARWTTDPAHACHPGTPLLLSPCWTIYHTRVPRGPPVSHSSGLRVDLPLEHTAQRPYVLSHLHLLYECLHCQSIAVLLVMVINYLTPSL